MAPLRRPSLWVRSQPVWTTGHRCDPKAAGRGDWQTKRGPEPNPTGQSNVLQMQKIHTEDKS